jgi:hypothetical protein
VFNDPDMMIETRASGFTLAYVLEDRVADELASGQILRVLEDWCAPYASYHLY